MTFHRSERLRFLRVDEKSGSHIWWPSLLYKSYRDMVQDHKDPKLRAYMALKSRGKIRGSSWAVLLGKYKPIDELIVPIAPNELESKVKDFILELEDMEEEYFKCHSWNLAKNQSLSILEDLTKSHPVQDVFNTFGDNFIFYDIISQDVDLPEQEESKHRNEEDVQPESQYKLEASMDNDDNLDFNASSNDSNDQLDSCEDTAIKEVKSKAKRKATNTANGPSQKRAKLTRKKQEKDNKLNSENTTKETRNHTKSKNKVQKSPTLSNDSKSSTSQITPQKSHYSDKNKKTPSYMLEERATFKVDDEWRQVMNVLLTNYGFYRITGSGLCSEYWVTGKCKRVEDEENLRKHLKENVDYFKGEDSLKNFAHDTYGWVGPSNKPFTPLVESRSRRRRQNSTQKQKLQPKKKQDLSRNQPNAKGQGQGREPFSKLEKKQKKNHVLTGNIECRSCDNETKTLKVNIDECLSRLNVSNNSNESLYSGSKSHPNFSLKQDSILNFLEKSMSQENSESAVMYVCGNPGMGKTTLVRHCVNSISSKKKICRELFLTASSISRAETILEDIAKALGKDVASDRISIESALRSTLKKRKTYVILVLDEIDFLLKDIGNRKMKDDSAFSSILKWASDSTFRMALIGISNSVGNADARLLYRHFEVGNELVFEPYDVDDLKGIILKRLGANSNLVEEKALEYATKKIAKNNGDARAVIDLFNKALLECKRSLSVEELDRMKVDTPVLKVVHVIKALRNIGIGSHVEIIQSLPQKVQTVLCVASALHQVSNGWKDISLSDLKRYCIEATNRGIIDDEMQSESFKGMVEQLEDAGLFCTGGVDEFTSRDQDCEFMDKSIRLGVQLEDVECAIEKSLLQNPIYQNIVGNIRKKGIDQNFS